MVLVIDMEFESDLWHKFVYSIDKVDLNYVTLTLGKKNKILESKVVRKILGSLWKI